MKSGKAKKTGASNQPHNQYVNLPTQQGNYQAQLQAYERSQVPIRAQMLARARAQTQAQTQARPKTQTEINDFENLIRLNANINYINKKIVDANKYIKIKQKNLEKYKKNYNDYIIMYTRKYNYA